jgi:micrococcal nuclease
VRVNGKDVMVNEYLVSEGYATSSTYPPDVKYQELFTKAESEARTQDKGVWSKCQASPVSQTVSSPSPEVKGTTMAVTTVSTPVVTASTPTASGNCLIKGNISSNGKIYHIPGCNSYDKTSIDLSAGERWFCSEDEAIAAGWRKAKNC